MAAALQCEICGGKLIGKPGGMFECDSCGMEYSTEWAKAKIQEIKGTVKVEGTVEVTGKVQVEGGTVQVEGAATTESLLKRAKLCLEDKDWDKAKELIEQALNGDPENGYAYLLRDMAEKKYSDEAEEIAYYVNINHPESENLKKAFRFSNASVEAFREKLEPLRQKDREAHTAFAKKLPALRAQISPAQDLLSISKLFKGHGYDLLLLRMRIYGMCRDL